MIFENVEKIIRPEGEVVKITHGSIVLWERPNIPLAYQQVEYIATDGNQVIDTGVKASDYQDGLEYVFEGNFTVNSAKTYDYIFGCLANNCRSGNVSLGNSGVTMLLGTTEAFRGGSVPVGTDFVIHAKGTSKDISNYMLNVNGTTLTNTGESRNTDMPSANIYLLASNINGNYYSSTSGPFTGKLYSFTMSDMNGNPLRNFVPCYRKSDGVIGLYDTVGKVFYTNIGTGSFTKGANI